MKVNQRILLPTYCHGTERCPHTNLYMQFGITNCGAHTWYYAVKKDKTSLAVNISPLWYSWKCRGTCNCWREPSVALYIPELYITIILSFAISLICAAVIYYCINLYICYFRIWRPIPKENTPSIRTLTRSLLSPLLSTRAICLENLTSAQL